MADKKGPVLSVRAFLENEEGQVLLLKRGLGEYEPGKWSLPGGVVEYTESPENSLERLVMEKTGLNISDLDFLSYLNSPPLAEGMMHCLNMYFKAKAQGEVKLSPLFTDYAWVQPRVMNNYSLAFKGNDGIRYYEASQRPNTELMYALVNEAGSMEIPVTIDRLTALQALPGIFDQLHDDMRVYESVCTRVHAALEMIQTRNRRGKDSIIVQVESRVKSYESLIEKMIRKGDNKIPRHHTTLNDVAGARAVVSFLKDVKTVRDELMQFQDFTLREEEDYIANPQTSGYRALHLTLEVPIPGASFIPRCEVQIKTAYQHSWSNIVHELVYKNGGIPNGYSERFRHLSDSLAEADETSNSLRHEIEHLSI